MRRPSTPASFPNRALPALLLLAALSPVLAASQRSGESRFEDRVRLRLGGVIGVEARAVEELGSSDELREGWESFRREQGGSWQVFLDERTAMPTLASGSGIQWIPAEPRSAVSVDQLEALARGFLSDNVRLLGDWSEMLVLDRSVSRELSPGHWQLVFRQLVDGLAVENARLDLHVKHGRLVLFGASHWGWPTIDGIPALDSDQARARLDAYLGEPSALYEQVGHPELALMAIDPVSGAEGPAAWTGPRGEGLAHVLVWRFRFQAPGEAPLWVAEVDAHEGTVRAFFDGAHYDSIRGGVFPLSNDGDCAGGGCEIQGFPMPFADFTESGQPADFADAFGNLACAVPSSDFETTLEGPYVRIEDTCGAASETGSCESGLDLGMKAGEACAVAPGASAGNTAAARTTFYQLNRIAETARFYDPGNAWLQDQLTVKVNVASSCNAFWNGTDITMYGPGNGCANTGELRGVLVHEWGHGYDANDGGGMDNTSEAYADVVAIFANRDSCMSRGWYDDGRTCGGYGDTCLTCTGIRDLDWAARADNTPATPAGFLNLRCEQGGAPCGKEEHCEGYVMGEAIYDLATRDLPAAGLDQDSAWQLAERLFYETRPGSGGNIYFCLRTNANSCGAGTWYQRMRVADDDDGDLSNGTPHAAALHAAFARHGIACGSAGNAENQSSSSCPTLAAPVLTVSETGPGTELSWSAVSGAAEYRVYRGDLGCERGSVPLAALGAGQTSFLDSEADPGLPRHYRVEAIGSNPACHSPVSSCESTPTAARLQKNGHRFVEPGAGNGMPDPGETVLMPVTLYNGGLTEGAGVTATLRFVDSAQGSVSDDSASWPVIPVNDSRESQDPHFELTVDPAVPCGTVVELEVEMMASGAATRTQRFPVQAGESAPEEAPQGLLVDKAENGAQLDLLFDWSAVALAAGYRVYQSPTPDYATEEEIGSTDGETHLTVGDGENLYPGLRYFQVRATNACGGEGP